MSAQIIPFVPRRDRKRGVIHFSIPAPPPDDLVMDHADEIPRHCEEQSDEAIHLSSHAALWIASLRSQ